MRWPRLATAAAGHARVGLYVALGVVVLAWGLFGRGAGAPVPTAEVTRGDFIETVDLRGEIQAARRATLTAPLGGFGETRILWLADNGAAVKQGDKVAELDATKLREAVEQARRDLNTVASDIARSAAAARIEEARQLADRTHAEHEVDRARTELTKQGLLPEVDLAQARLRLADAVQALAEAETELSSGRIARGADLESKRQNRAKAEGQLHRAERAAAAMTLFAPTDGMVIILPNPRAQPAGASAPELRTGDTVSPGAPLLQLPDLSRVLVAARVDESDRGRLRPGQPAGVRVDALGNRELPARVREIGLLARVDFSQVPVAKTFDVVLEVAQALPWLRPGMGARARVEVDRVSATLLMPAAALFDRPGGTSVFVKGFWRFEERTVHPLRRGADAVALKAGVTPGERVALRDPRLGAGS